jgi:ring-1,2-phenylacetyl-CoA epoxidase subunit PaaC
MLFCEDSFPTHNSLFAIRSSQLKIIMTINPLFSLSLALADDALVLGHRLSEWSGRAPMLEEDIALSNLGLDLIGQARLFYAYAGEIEGKGRSEDAFAYFRDAAGYRNLLLLELEIGDFAHTIARQFLYAAFVHPYFQALAKSKDSRLAEIAAKAVKEMAYHLRHTSEWMIRLGDGTAESKRRMTDALEELWGYTGEMFEMDQGERALAAEGIAPNRAALRAGWNTTVDAVLREATLLRPVDRGMQIGGRAGRHTEALDPMLAEMQVLARQHPGATW